jgi:hypothetical protein
VVIDQYPSGFYLFAGPDTEEGLAEAKSYCAANGLTKQEVTLIRIDDGASKSIIVKKK